MQQDGASATKLFHQAPDPAAPGQVSRHWFEAERSKHAVGGEQKESRAEAAAAAARGKAVSAHLGPAPMGSRFNALLTVQVPLRQSTPRESVGRPRST